MTPRRRLALRNLNFAAGMLALVAAGVQAAPVYFQGSAYEVVDASIKWEDALLAAGQRSFLGVPGRLATVTSAAENAFLAALAPPSGYYFVGGSDVAVEGTWTWVTGKEAGTVFDSAPGTPGTVVTAHFQLGELQSLSTATVQARQADILGNSFRHSVHSEVAAPVPEPAAWALFAAGGLSLALLGRRRRVARVG
ncbi:MAG: PEP-CTERM sorting domain-containing protein [Burkholderiaceae bacterium]|nr:PEP-CTERM sorting domain-containing protein [Burkholderiaceae bacterium]